MTLQDKTNLTIIKKMKIKKWSEADKQRQRDVLANITKDAMHGILTSNQVKMRCINLEYYCAGRLSLIEFNSSFLFT